MNTTKQDRFEEFRYELPIICSCGYPMKCITEPSMEPPKNILTTEELVVAGTGAVEATFPTPSESIFYECINCLKWIKVGNYK